MLEFIRLYQVQSQWEKRVLKSLNSMCMELGQSLAKPRCQNEQQELLTHWNDLSNLDMDLSLFRPVYSPKVRYYNAARPSNVNRYVCLGFSRSVVPTAFP